MEILEKPSQKTTNNFNECSFYYKNAVRNSAIVSVIKLYNVEFVVVLFKSVILLIITAKLSYHSIYNLLGIELHSCELFKLLNIFLCI